MRKTIAVILAGGIGRRFWPLVTSKSLFPFLSKPMLLHTLESIKSAGFQDVVIVTSKNDELKIRQITKRFKRLKIAVQASAKGMADALLSAKEFLSGNAIFVVNAHDLLGQEAFDIAYRNQGKHQAFIIAKSQREYFPGGYLAFSKKRLTGISEKPGAGKEPSDLINLVLHYFSQADDFLRLLQTTKSKKDDVYEQALSRFIEETEFKVFTYDGYWQALKFPWHVLDMLKLFLEARLKPDNRARQIAKSAHLDKNVYLGYGVKVLENVVIKGPSYIGSNTVIGTGALVLESMLGENCVIGFGSEVARSYIGAGCWLHTNYIGDSILEGGNYFGAGAVTANFRFDAGSIRSLLSGEKIDTKKTKLGSVVGQGARVGVNASLMPGVKIGSGAFIGPGVVLYRDQPENTAIRVKQTYRKLNKVTR